jgi:hypothetical protein
VWRDGDGASVDVGGGAGGGGAGAGAGGEEGALTSLESSCGRAADVSARAVRSRRWWVPAAAAAIARSGEGVQRLFRSASGSGH